MSQILLNRGIVPATEFGVARDKSDSFLPTLRENLVWGIAPQIDGPTHFLQDISGRNQRADGAGSVVWFNGKWGHEHDSTGDRTVLGAMDDIVPLNNITILMGYEKTDATARQGGAFGSDSITATRFCNGIPKWTDGRSYWAFGGNTSGTSSIDTTTHGDGDVTMGDDNWAFISGDRGMEMWQNGIIVAQNGNSVARTADATNELEFGRHISFGSDLAVYRYFLVFNRTLSPSELMILGSNPLAMFEPMMFIANGTGSATIFERDEEDDLGLTDDVDANAIFSRSESDNLNLTDEAGSEGVFPRSLSDTINFVQVGTEAPVPVESELELEQNVVYLNVVGDRQVPENTLNFVQTVETGLFQYLEDDLNLTQDVVKIGPINISLTQHLGIRDAVTFCFGAPWAAIEIEHDLNLTGGNARRGVDLSVSDTLSLTDIGVKVDPAESDLNFQQFVSVGKSSILNSVMLLTDVVQTENEFIRALSDTDFLEDATAYFIDNPCVTKVYNQFEGSGSADGIPEEPLTFDAEFMLETLSGPKEKLYLRSPETDDRHRIGYTRINRETRGGELSIYQDSNWPSVDTLLFTIVALSDGKGDCPDKINDLLDFFQTNLGIEIMLHDWEGISWRGIITTPNEVAVEDRDGWWTMTFEFEGIQLDGSQGDQRVTFSDSLLVNAIWGRSLSDDLGLTDEIAVSGILAHSLTDTISFSQTMAVVNETPVLDDDFSGSGAVDLHGQSPDIGTSTWSAHENYQADGSQTAINSGAYYPFAPQSGTTYHIEWEARSLAESSGNETTFFLGEGLNAAPNNIGGSAYGAFDPTTLKAGFVLRNISATQKNACRLGDNTSGEADTIDFSDATLKAEADDIDLRLELDTTGGAGTWKATWYAKDTVDTDWTEVRAEEKLLSEDIAMVGWANNNTTTTVNMNNISITEKVYTS